MDAADDAAAFFTQIAPLWPSYHLSQLAQMAIGIQPWSGADIHIAWIAGRVGGVLRHRAPLDGEGGVSIMLRAPVVRLIVIAVWSLAVLAAAATIGSHDADRSAYPAAHSGARP